MTELLLPFTKYQVIVKVEGTLVDCLSQLKSVAADPINGEQLARARIYNGEESEICKNGTWLVGYDHIRLPNGDLLMTLPKQSIIRKTVATHRDEEKIYLSKRQLGALLERASTDLAEARDSGVLRIPKDKIAPSLPTNKYGEIIETQFVYGASAKTYGDFLHQRNFTYSRHEIGYPDSKGAFACCLWVYQLPGEESALDGSDALNDGGGGLVFGVQKMSAKRAALNAALKFKE